MARRKKEARSVHRKTISTAAEQLFLKKGIENTSMSDIAEAAGYSKATLYVYFQNKEELVGFLVLESMRRLYDYMQAALQKQKDTAECYREICLSLVRYQEEYPFYFHMVLEKINVDFTAGHFLPEEKETFLVGEKINGLLADFLESGIARGDIRPDIEVMPTIFSLWGMLAGLIRLADTKQEYIAQSMKKSRQDFLFYGFDLLYRSIVV